MRRFPTHFMGFVEGQATEKLNLKTAGAFQKKNPPQKNGRTTGWVVFFAGEQREIELGGVSKNAWKSEGTMHEGI